jgi:hypothetical protein
MLQPVLFFLTNFCNLVTKKKGAGESNKGIFELLKKKHSPYLDQKILEVARFRQCVPAGHQI